MHTPKNRIFKILAVVALLVVLLINSKTITNSARIAITDLASPLLKSFHSLSFVFKKITPFYSFVEENSLLRDRIDLLNRKLEEARVIYEENRRLKNLLSFKKIIVYSTVPSQVVGRDPSNWSNSIIIDKGTAGGIRQNTAVLSTKGLVGRTLEVGKYSSKILLITDPNSKVGVLIRRNRQGGILMGRPDGTCKMVYIALDSDVVPGDKVITAGFGKVFPKDILVGEVVKVQKEPGRLYKYAVVKPAADLSKLEEVLCIK